MRVTLPQQLYKEIILPITEAMALTLKGIASQVLSSVEHMSFNESCNLSILLSDALIIPDLESITHPNQATLVEGFHDDFSSLITKPRLHRVDLTVKLKEEHFSVLCDAPIPSSK